MCLREFIRPGLAAGGRDALRAVREQVAPLRLMRPLARTVQKFVWTSGGTPSLPEIGNKMPFGAFNKRAVAQLRDSQMLVFVQRLLPGVERTQGGDARRADFQLRARGGRECAAGWHQCC